jgi:hypothetical protein
MCRPHEEWGAFKGSLCTQRFNRNVRAFAAGHAPKLFNRLRGRSRSADLGHASPRIFGKQGHPSRLEITDVNMGERAECVTLNKGLYAVRSVRVLADILKRMQAHRGKSVLCCGSFVLPLLSLPPLDIVSRHRDLIF